MNRPQLMGILNLTPDSFSGDGATTIDAALARFGQLVCDGAAIVDLGAESTRPGATPLAAGEEWARLAPVLEALRDHPQRHATRLSIDSYHAENVARALRLGVDIANDVSGLRDAAMAHIVATHDGDVVVMHALTVPADSAVTLPAGSDPIAEILAWKTAVTARAEKAGINPARLVYDPGLGFGKSAAQSREVMVRAASLVQSGGRWLIGHSRKSFLAAIHGNRDEATLIGSALLAQAGVEALRVHDVTGHRKLFDALCT